MAAFDVSVHVDAPVQRTWDALTDWVSHGRWAPLTRVRVTSDRATGLGAAFVARTGVGRLGFDDPMVVVEWQPPRGQGPGRCTVRKTGKLVLGWATFEVAGVAGRSGSSRVSWHEEVELAPVRLTRPLSPLLTVLGRLFFGRAMRRFAASL